ncbi:MAG TPA: Gfo/Idh/MocA family oxidoreductase [Luteitalea sp.]|nr:Gfo/Idh/MocA family oxidoreductase [Luteitalea sp.]
MPLPLDRRSFLKSASATIGAGLIAPAAASAAPAVWRQAGAPSDRVRVAIMGVNSRGSQLARAFLNTPGAVITTICDVDTRAAAKAAELVGKAGTAPTLIPDVRKVLESRDIDALVIAAPDHWHAPAAMLALDAGKHVYVEKPASHNPREGELLVEAQKRTGKVVQMGNQRRSWPNVQKAIGLVHGGRIGKVYNARTWYANTRPSIGKGKPVPVPEWLDYELWQGPAPRREFVDNLVHYEWHWRWHWGTGESANNGTHMFDLARWGLQVEHPTRVTSSGGRFQFADDWEFPDTQVIALDYPGGKMITWESMSANGYKPHGTGVGVTFHGDQGSLLIDGDGYTIYDLKGGVVEEIKTDPGAVTSQVGPAVRLDALHTANFVAGIRGTGTLATPIDGGHTSTMMALLGNIAWKTGRALTCDPATGRIQNDADATAMWGREYAPGWAPKT